MRRIRTISGVTYGYRLLTSVEIELYGPGGGYLSNLVYRTNEEVDESAIRDLIYEWIEFAETSLPSLEEG